MYLLSCKYTKLTWTQPKPGWAFCFLAWEADTHLSHDAAETWTVTEISLYIYIYIYAFSRRFYPKRLTIAFRLYIFISICVPWESNPQPFALLTQCSPTEPHRNIMSSIKHVLWSASSVLGRCPVERLHWAVLLIPQGGARSVHLSLCFMMKTSSCSCLVSLAWWSAGDEASSLSLLVSPGLWEEAAGWESCPDVSLSGVCFSSRDWIHVSLVHHWNHAPLKHSGLAGFQTHYNMSLRG